MAGTTLAEPAAQRHGDERDVSDEEEEEEHGKSAGGRDGVARSEVSDEEEDHDGPKYTSVQSAADEADKEGEGEGSGKFDEVSL